MQHTIVRLHTLQQAPPPPTCCLLCTLIFITVFFMLTTERSTPLFACTSFSRRLEDEPCCEPLVFDRPELTVCSA